MTEGYATSGDYGSGKGISNQGEEHNAANNKNNNSSERQKDAKKRNQGEELQERKTPV